MKVKSLSRSNSSSVPDQADIQRHKTVRRSLPWSVSVTVLCAHPFPPRLGLLTRCYRSRRFTKDGASGVVYSKKALQKLSCWRESLFDTSQVHELSSFPVALPPPLRGAAYLSLPWLPATENGETIAPFRSYLDLVARHTNDRFSPKQCRGLPQQRW